jgi:hypothetical protein
MRRSAKQTARQNTPCINLEPTPIVSAPALLQLARWSLKRQQTEHGGQQCDASMSDSVPPNTDGRDHPVRLSGLWRELPAQSRQDLLITLSRLVAQCLPNPLAEPEVPHEG